MKKRIEYNQQLLHNLADLKAEVIAAELQITAAAGENFFFQMLGGFKRPHTQDLANVEYKNYDKSNNWLIFKINRDGLYDALPEGVFHKKKNLSPNKGADEVVEEIRQHKKEEVLARSFFAPFENELFYTRLLMEQKEKASFDFLALADSSFTSSFKNLWNIPASVDKKYLPALFKLLPSAWKIKGMPQTVAVFIQEILQIPVKISHATLQSTIPEEIYLPLGFATLGLDTLLCANNLNQQAWNVHIGPVPKMLLEDFLPEHSGITVLSYILQVLSPTQVTCNFMIDIELDENLFTLSMKIIPVI